LAGQLGAEVAGAGFCLVSGGARGIDEAAMTGALDGGGQVIGVLADSLLKAIVAQKWRAALRRGDLVLVSPHHPEAAFNVGNAMARNKHVYCLAEAAVVVHSGTSGGTWSGALENLQHAWVPLWVRKTDDPESGNAGLVDKGGRWLPDVMSESLIRELPTGSVSAAGESTVEAPATYPAKAVDEPPPARVAEQSTVETRPQVSAPATSASSNDVGPESIYRAFRDTLLGALADGPRKLKELEPLTGLTAGQLKVLAGESQRRRTDIEGEEGRWL
jgi:predicted Rossmann fold nucleotide-binding protein DprA/Smf involved in DNA uptake